MPKAAKCDTSSSAIAILRLLWSEPPTPSATVGLSYQDAILRETCRAAMNSHGAMLALSISVADLPPDEARHAAADAAINVLKPTWQDQMEQVSSIPAVGPAGLYDKAELLESLIDREEDGSVAGGSLLSLAVSLAEDVLRQHAGA